jgi:hypothetical protein
MRKALWFTFALGLLLYVTALVLFAKLKYDAGFMCMLAASVILILSGGAALIRWIRRKHQ